MAEAFTDLTQWFSIHFGWLVLLVCACFVAFAGYICFSRYGSIRLGGPDERPQFNTLSWIAMLFAAGMGSGLVFYGAAEPLTHFVNAPPASEMVMPGAGEARRAMALSLFHWGIHAWAIYAMAALTIAFFTFHKQLPMLPSAPIQGAVPLRVRGIVSRLVDMAGIVGVVFGLVASLSMAILQISEGFMRVFGPTIDIDVLRLLILGAMFICYTISASTG